MKPTSIDTAGLLARFGFSQPFAVELEFVTVQLLLARDPELDDHARPYAAALSMIVRDAAEHAATLDRLPVYLTHSDFQSKNILAGTIDGQPRICIIDAESAQLHRGCSTFIIC